MGFKGSPPLSDPKMVPNGPIWTVSSIVFGCGQKPGNLPILAAGFIMTAPRCVSVSMGFQNRLFYNRFCTSSKPIVIIVRCPCVSVSMAF